MKKILILGSTGSIGRQTVSVLENLGLTAAGLSANTDVDRIEEQIRTLRPAFAAMTDPDAAKELKNRVVDTKTKVFSGEEGLLEMIREADFDVAVNGIVGMAGTKPFLEVIRRGKPVAVANKESLVTAGPLIKEEARRHGAKILPVDSEHSAVFQCLQAAPETKRLKRIFLTASGGPFFGQTKEQLNCVTPADALRHPSWKMGAKITVDCATMMNKGLEIMEAVRLFDVEEKDVEVLIHRESIVHSLIEFDDNSVLAQLGLPDMRIAIQYALTYPDRLPSPVESLDLTTAASLTFAKPDLEVFPATELCRWAIREDGLYPTAVNAANEVAVHAFLNNRLSFPAIVETVRHIAESIRPVKNPDLEQIFACDKAVREETKRYLESL
ncbi:MAG: 1-deoxy-D-xylulose-5-phosphate reductoisomerase [Clostridia bacterium]|nr:1-deoxy-D-xylulose-5-phosphate reductoisomerase [Clostridia bacterium]